MRSIVRLACELWQAIVVAFVVLALVGCAAAPARQSSQLPLCPTAQAHLIQTPTGPFAAFDGENLDIFLMAIQMEARGECRFD